MKLKLFLFLIFLHLSLFAQKNTIDITVKDNATKKNIEWASLSINKKYFLSSSEEGKISLVSSLFKETDSITISALGYLSKTYILKQLNEEITIVYLLPDVQVLNEVVVNSNNVEAKKVVLGYGYNFSIVTTLTGLNTKYAQFIPNNDGLNCKIKELEFILTNAQKGIDQPFRVNIYSRDKISKFPSKELIEDDLIVRNYKKSKKFTVDVSKYNITTPKDGFFIVAETLNEEYYSNKEVVVHNRSFYRLPTFKVKATEKPNGDFYNLSNINSMRWYKNNKLGYTTYYFTAVLLCQ